MPRSRPIEPGGHYAVGPLIHIGGHGPVTMLARRGSSGEMVTDLLVCLDCGYVDSNQNEFHYVECDRRENPINQTWREFGLGLPE